MKIVAIAIVVVVIASTALGMGLYLAHGKSSSGKVYEVKVMQSDGTYSSFNLSGIGGYAYVPSSTNGIWTLNHPLTRIVSLVPSVSSTLYALGAYSDVVGVDQYSIYPAPTKNVSVFNIQVGSIPLESIANLTPDAIITTIGGFPQQDINQVVNVLHIPYIVMDPGNITQIEVQNTILGYFTGDSSNSSTINSWMNFNLGNLEKDLQSVSHSSQYSVFYDLGSGSGGLYTAGPGTFINSMFQAAHLRNVVNATGYPVVTISSVYNSTPDYVLLDQYVSVSDMNTSLPGLGAVKNGSYIVVSNDTFFDEPNFRTIYSIYWLAEKFYPGLVNMTSIVNFNSYTGLNLNQDPEAGVNG